MTFEGNENTGLSSIEVNQRIKEGLVNGDENVTTKTIKQIVAGNLFTLFNILNISLAVMVIIVGSYKSALFMGVVLCNLIIGTVQEIKAKKIIDKLKIISSQNSRVIRDGTECFIPISQLVLDDIVLLKSGEQIGADCVLISGNCQVNESLVTGESDAIDKKLGDELLSGSFVVSGMVKCRVTGIGSDKYVNKISDGARYVKKPNSEILITVKSIVKVATILLFIVFVFLFRNQMNVYNNVFSEAIVDTVAGVKDMIPSGLLLLISTVLATSVIKLSKYDTLVQELYCIETLARCDTICLDKTGTITNGEMEVRDVSYLKEDASHEINRFVWSQDDVNATLKALQNHFPGQKNCAPEFVIPFNSEKKYSVSCFSDGTYFLGAPEFLFENIPEDVSALQEKYMEDGLRVIVFAKSESTVKTESLPKDIIPIAIIALADTLRGNAAETISYFIEQNVRILVISGDHPKTIRSIAKAAGIPEYDKIIDMSTVNDEDISDIAGEYTIYGRVKPQQKLALIKALKEKEHTVAMTGDGVNDVLALKEADCSIAMQSGSSAARCVSQIVLLNSDFASMPKIVAEGRRSINNIQRSASLFLVKTIYAGILGLIFAFFARSYPIEPIQSTLLTALYIGIPGLLLGFEPNYNIVKGNFFITIIKRAIPGGLLVATNVMITILTAYLIGSTSSESTMIMYTTGFCMALLLYNNCKPFNKWRTFIIVAMPILFILTVLIGFQFFELQNISLKQFVSLLILMVIDYILYYLLCNMVNIVSLRRKDGKHIKA